MTKENFWNWFNENSDKFLTSDELTIEEKEALFAKFDTNLQLYCEGLSFEIKSLSENGREIIFSAEGDVDLFDKLIELVDAAPEIDWWEFTPFKQAYGADLSVRFYDMVFNTKEMYFLPLENEEEPDVIGLQIAVPNFKFENEDQEMGAYTALEAQIGEYDCATLIAYMELTAIPKKVEDTDFISLLEFPNYVNWFKEKHQIGE